MKTRLAWSVVWSVLIAVSIVVLGYGVAQADFSDPVYFNPDGSYQLAPDAIEGPDGTVYVTWTSYGSDGTGRTSKVLLSSSTDGGATWSAPITVISYSFSLIYYMGDYRGAKLAIDDHGVFHITFRFLNYYSGYSYIYYGRSADSGQTWSFTTSNWACFNWFSNIALDSNSNVHLAWYRWKCLISSYPDRVFYRQSLDNGLTWGASREIYAGSLPSNEGATAQSMVVDGADRIHLIVQGPAAYLRSDDAGATWQDRTSLLPSGFGMSGIFRYGDALLISGLFDGKYAFVRSGDLGASWEGPFTFLTQENYWMSFNQIVANGSDYYAWFVYDQRFVRSRDNGLTWEEPEYMGAGRFSKLLVTRTGDILVFGTFGDQAAVIRRHEPFKVDAPDYLSLWEKSDFVYSFKVAGTGEVQVSLPDENIEVAQDVIVTVGTGTAAGSVTKEGGRILVTFPVDVAAWTECKLPITVEKANVKKLSAVRARIADLEAKQADAAAAMDGAAGSAIEEDLQTLNKELFSIDREIDLSLLYGSQKVTDRTNLAIYDTLTSVYAHFKANPPNQQGAALLLLSDSAVAAPIGAPFKLDVKLTHLTEGAAADVSISGAFSTIERRVNSETGVHKSVYYLFYPPTYLEATDTIQVTATVNGISTTVPISVTLR